MENNLNETDVQATDYSSPKYYQLREVADQFHPHAISEAEQHIDRFISTLITYAQTSASQKNDELVLRKHVDESVSNMTSRKSKWRWLYKIGFLISSTMLGIVVPSFFTELSKLTNPPSSGTVPPQAGSLVITYFVISIIMSCCLVWFMMRDEV